MLEIISSQQRFNAWYGRRKSKCWTTWPIYFVVTLSVFSVAEAADVVVPKVAFPNILPLAGAIGADLFAPSFKIKKMIPDDGSKDVDLNIRVSVSFNAKLKGDVESDALLMKDAEGNEVAGDIRVDEQKIIFTPAATLSPGVVYTILLSEQIRSQSDARLAGQRQASFSTIKKPIKSASAIGADFLREEPAPKAAPPITEEKPAGKFVEPPALVAKPERPIEPLAPVAKPEQTKISDDFGDFAEKVLPVPVPIPSVVRDGAAKDSVGNEAQKPDVEPATSAKAPVVQAPPLVLLYSFPTDGAQNADIKSVIGVQFSKAFLSDDARIRLLTHDDQEVDGKTSYQSNRMIFESSVPLDYGRSYTASVEGVLTDIEGSSLSEKIQWSFTTASQLDRLAITKQAGLSTSEIFVKQIVLDNNTILSEALVNSILADYENREVTASELQQLRKRLSLEVYKQGYVNSGVIIPDQKVGDGIIHLALLQGKLSKIQLSGQQSVSADYINQRVTLGASEPLNYFELRRSLLLLEQDPLIKRVTAKLLPGDKLGESYLDLKIDEDNPYLMSLSINNYHAPSVGSERVEFLVGHRNLLGIRDMITGFYGQTRGHKEGYLSYNIPLNVYDTQLAIGYSLTDAEIIEEPFNDETDVTSESSAWQVKLSHPFVKTLTTQLTASAGFDKKSSEITIIIPGQTVNERGESSTGPKNVTNLWLSLEGLNRGKKRVFAWQGKVKWGVDMFDATIETDDYADGKYGAVQGNFYFSHYVSHLLDKIVVRGMGQITNDTVLPTEKFAAGGVHTVRGYRENQFVRDNGVAGSIELYFPIRDGNANLTDLTVMSFFDYARLRNKTSGNDSNPVTNQMYSLGLGILWEPKSALQAQAFWGKALKAVSDEDNRDENDNLQDLGFHLQLSYRLL